jgi:hypothetical protein
MRFIPALFAAALTLPVQAQVPTNLTAEGIPPIPADLQKDLLK